MNDELHDLEDALDLVNKVSLTGAPSATKSEALATFARCQNKLDAAKAHAMTAFEATQEHRAEGHATPIAWLKSHCREEGRDAARWRVARYARAMPLVDEAWTDGLITTSHVELLHRAQHLVGEQSFALAEEALVDAALGQRFSDFARTVEYFIVRAQPRDAESRARQAVEDRFASSSRTFGGNGVVDAQLEPIGFTLWDAELQRLCQQLLEADRADAHDRLGRRPLPSELGRSPRQRRADAMVLMSQRSAAHDSDTLSASTFTLVVHGEAELVARIVEFLHTELANDEPDHEPDLGDLEHGPQSLHELDDGTVITVNTLVLAMLTGVVRGILFDPQGEVLRLGRDRRLFTRPQALALRAKFRRCCHPYGCDATAPFVQSDHHTEWDDGGSTDIENGKVLHGGHNIWKTNHKHHPPPPTPIRTNEDSRPTSGPLHQPDDPVTLDRRGQDEPMPPPPRDVCERFGARDGPVPLDGGQADSYRAGDLVRVDAQPARRQSRHQRSQATTSSGSAACSLVP